MNDFKIFGEFVRAKRVRRGLPLWKLAAAVPFPQSNVQRIEAGVTEPRIGLAMRMLIALDVDAGRAMRDIAARMEIVSAALPEGEPLGVLLSEIVKTVIDDDAKTPAALFGLLLRGVRLAMGRTQAQVAEAACYTTRSMILVEKGRQEPGLVSALRLAAGTGCGLNCYFDAYEELLKNSLLY